MNKIFFITLFLAVCENLCFAQNPTLPKMAFKIDGEKLYLIGSLDFDRFPEFSDLLDTKKFKLIVFNDVLGGTLRTVESFGYKISQLQIETQIDGKCFSACALVFLKGYKRTVNGSRQNVIAFHGPRLPNGDKLPAFAAFHKRWIIASTGGKFPADLIDKALEINANEQGAIICIYLDLIDKALEINANDGALFIYTDTLLGLNRTWAMLCEHYDQCKVVPNANPYELGVLTD